MIDDPDMPAPLSREESEHLARARRGRNIALLVVLLALSLLFYALAMVKLTKPDLG
jgi:hypothetical protein